MNHAPISYRDFQNGYQLARITELMESLRPLFPEWPETINVERIDKFDESDQSTMSIILNTDYLHFHIEVYNCFWQVPEENQRRKFIHEIVHALHADVIMFNRDRMIDYIKAQNADLGAYIAQEHTARIERFTQTMAFAIERMILATEAKAKQTSPVFGPTVSPMEGMRLVPTPGVSRDILKEMERFMVTEQGDAAVACAKCGGGQVAALRAGSKPGVWFCGTCWDSLYQHGNGAEPAKPYNGVQAIAANNPKGTP